MAQFHGTSLKTRSHYVRETNGFLVYSLLLFTGGGRGEGSCMARCKFENVQG